jgi:hypothetical protein
MSSFRKVVSASLVSAGALLSIMLGSPAGASAASPPPQAPRTVSAAVGSLQPNIFCHCYPHCCGWR